MKKPTYKIGIDPGTNTGIAVWCNEEKELVAINTMKIHEAILAVLQLRQSFELEMVIEDPNTWVQFRQNNQAKARAQGAGSVKRDFAIRIDDEGLPELYFENIREERKYEEMPLPF